MDSMNKVTMHICGANYVVTTDETPGYMQELAAIVDTSICNMMNNNERTSLVMAAVMTAVVQADEARKAVQSADNLRKQLKTFFDDNNRSRQDADAMRREVERLKKENEDLNRKLAAQ